MKVLVVDDRLRGHEPLIWLLRERSFIVDTAQDVAEALERLKNNGPYSIIISDYMLGPNYQNEELDNGAYLLSKSKELSPETATVLYTMSSDAIERTVGIADKGFLKQNTSHLEFIDWIVRNQKRSRSK